MGKFSQTWELMGNSWEVLKKDRELLVFPLLSGVCCLVVMASFALPIILSGYMEELQQEETAASLREFLLMFLFYFCNYFVIIFFNAALISCAAIRLQGGNPTLADGFKASFGHFHQIFGWTLIAATVGMILRLIEERSEWVGQLVAGILGMAWSAVSFLVIPVMVVEGKSPIGALKDSTALFKRTWGEQVISYFSFGFVYFVLGIPGYALIAGGVYFFTVAGNAFLGGPLATLGILYLVGLALVQAAQQAIFQAALYFYARDGQVPPGAGGVFSREALAGAYGVKG